MLSGLAYVQHEGRAVRISQLTSFKPNTRRFKLAGPSGDVECRIRITQFRETFPAYTFKVNGVKTKLSGSGLMVHIGDDCFHRLDGASVFLAARLDGELVEAELVSWGGEVPVPGYAYILDSVAPIFVGFGRSPVFLPMVGEGYVDYCKSGTFSDGSAAHPTTDSDIPRI